MKKIRVVIESGNGRIDTFIGLLVSETSNGYVVTHTNNSRGEWFPIASKYINSYPQ